MKVSIDNGELVIRIPMAEKTSSSGKNILIATSGGGKPTDLQYNGKPVTVNVSAYIPVTKD